MEVDQTKVFFLKWKLITPKQNNGQRNLVIFLRAEVCLVPEQQPQLNESDTARLEKRRGLWFVCLVVLFWVAMPKEAHVSMAEYLAVLCFCSFVLISLTTQLRL